MQFISTYQIDPALCDHLIALHKKAEKQGIARPGAVANEAGERIVNREVKHSVDLRMDKVPDRWAQTYHVPEFYQALKECVDQYVEQHPILASVAAYRLTTPPLIQYYPKGGGFKREHFERNSLAASPRFLVWMAYLNTVDDGGGTRFVYQERTEKAEKGKLVIWPPDFTHTHVGEISPSQEKYIITGWLNYVA